MIVSTVPVLAAMAQPQPLFGNQWLALFAILAGVAVFILAVAGVGRWLAATHPDEPAKSAAAPAGGSPRPQAQDASATSPEVFAVIAASVYAMFGSRSRISSVTVVPAPSTAQWSLEGRRQIYSSHQVR